MFEISELKAKKLPELQEIAKSLNVPKYRTQKKLDLVYQILDYQASNPTKVKEVLKEEPASQPGNDGTDKKEPTSKNERNDKTEKDQSKNDQKPASNSSVSQKDQP